MDLVSTIFYIKWKTTKLYKGMGPLPSIYFSEAFPLSHRELGAGLTICINNAVGSALSLTFPSLLKALGPTGAFGFYAGLNMLAFVVIFFIVPETMYATHRPLQSHKMKTANLSAGNGHWKSSTLFLACRRGAIFRTRSVLGCLGSLRSTSFSSVKRNLSLCISWMV